jgi:TctA family transporter
MNTKPTSGWIGLGILAYVIGVFTLSIYIDQSGLVKGVPIYSVHGPIENIFFSIMWLTLFIWVLILARRRERKTFEWKVLFFYAASIIGFAWFGVYFFGVQLLTFMFFRISKAWVRNVT